MPTQEPLVKNETIGKVIKGAGELVVPGLSLLLNKQYKDGALHALAGFAASAFLGPMGLVLAGADSFSKAETGKSLMDRFQNPPATPAKASAR
jgi:hypothetical protein